MKGREEQDQKRQCQRTAQKQPVAKAPPASQPDTTLPLYETTGKEEGECQDL